ncbi:hypothetical protein L1I30_12070 [Gillisia sp. M10.2A]|uniref:CarboxypepD_reg-like domain-containing protein n=1 Tax=Gillisia lutea TaxID=2909668 RepID=A0ABS9EKT1_9FLAO|nr:hypothetical protein [Gillisia lutea]MCF4102405.1 hypothetical protein [Gillisia lutea]
MKKVSFLLLLIFLGAYCYGQTAGRTQISGTIQVPVGENPGGVSVYNLNSLMGAISDAQGSFTLAMAVNDSIEVSAIQFEKFTVIIDESVIDSGEINIYVKEIINKLPEVVVSPYDLSGNINTDISRLQVVRETVSMTGAEAQNIYFESETNVDTQSPPKNKALEFSQTRLVNGLNFVNIFKALLLTSKQEQVKEPYASGRNLNTDTALRELYKDEFFQENLGLPVNEINDFIFYADNNGLSEQMLRKGNELDLIEFLIDQAKRYKKQRSKK